MAIGWNTRYSLPRLRTYADADRRERETKPIKGDDKERKPIAQRSMKWRHIKRGDDGTITVHNADLPILKFYPDDTVEVTPEGYWNKATSHDLIGEILGLPIQTESRYSWVRCNGGIYRMRPTPRQVYDSETKTWKQPEKATSGNMFKYESGRWVFLNPEEYVVHHINRKEKNRVSKQYATFGTYLSAMCKLVRDETPSWDEYARVFNLENDTGSPYYKWYRLPKVPGDHGFTHDNAASLCEWMLSDEPEDQYKAFLLLYSNYWRLEVAQKRMEKCILMHHHAEILTPVPVPDGTKRIDKYQWAIPPQSRTT